VDLGFLIFLSIILGIGAWLFFSGLSRADSMTTLKDRNTGCLRMTMMSLNKEAGHPESRMLARCSL